MYLLAPFILQNFKKILGIIQRIQSYEDWPICHEQIFFIQPITITFIYLLALSLFKIFKKFFQRIHSYKDGQLLDLKWPIFPSDNFFQKTC